MSKRTPLLFPVPAVLVAVLFTVLLAQTGRAGAEKPPADPIDPVPVGDPPAFREVLRGAKWDEPFGKALAALGGLDALAGSPAPEGGSLIQRVAPNGRAKGLGLLAGQTITKVDGQPLYLHDLSEFRRDKDQSFTVLATSGKSREVTVSPGLIGVSLLPFVRPELAFLRHGPRKAAWDAFAAVGAARCFSNPDLAETAWQHAITAGYLPDELSDFCGMQIAWRQGRNDEALRWLESMQARPDAFPSLARDLWVRELATANFKMEQAIGKPLMVPNPDHTSRDVVDEYLGELLKAYRRRPAAQRLLGSPSELAVHTTSLMGAMVPRLSTDHTEDDFRRSVSDLLAKKGEFHEKAASGHYQRFLEMPRDDAGAVRVTFEVSFTASDDLATQGDKFFAAGLVNCDREECMDLDRFPAGGSMLCAFFGELGDASFLQDSDRQVHVQELPASGEVGRGQKFTLRLLHAAGRDEVWLNNRRMVYLPTEENPKKVGFFFAHVGTAIDVKADCSRIDLNADGH